MIGPEHNFALRWGINCCILALIFGIGIYVWNVRDDLRVRTANAVLSAQHHADHQISREQRRADHKLCVEIEKIKSALREKENEDYSHLHRDLRLLRITPTPEILGIARRQHRHRLARFKPQPCRVKAR